jgi:hypothetical protein
MKRVEEKLASWHRLYQELCRAETRLHSAHGPSADNLEDEVKRLQRESDRAMDEVHAALARKKQSPQASAGESRAGAPH